MHLAKLACILGSLISASNTAVGSDVSTYQEPAEPLVSISCPAVTHEPAAQPEVGIGEFHCAKGKFVQLGNGRWEELRDNGPSSYFKEKKRNSQFIELYDTDRDMRVRLYETEGKWFNTATNSWVKWPGSEGHWCER
jgi:hypothetical protein